MSFVCVNKIDIRTSIHLYIYVKILNFISFDKSLLKIHEQEFIGKLYVARKLLKRFLITERMPIVSTRFKLSEDFIRKTRSHTITLISYLSEDRSHTDKYKLYRRL